MLLLRMDGHVTLNWSGLPRMQWVTDGTNVVAAITVWCIIREFGAQWDDREIPSFSISIISTETSKLCLQVTRQCQWPFTRCSIHTEAHNVRVCWGGVRWSRPLTISAQVISDRLRWYCPLISDHPRWSLSVIFAGVLSLISPCL